MWCLVSKGQTLGDWSTKEETRPASASSHSAECQTELPIRRGEEGTSRIPEDRCGVSVDCLLGNEYQTGWEGSECGREMSRLLNGTNRADREVNDSEAAVEDLDGADEKRPLGMAVQGIEHRH